MSSAAADSQEPVIDYDFLRLATPLRYLQNGITSDNATEDGNNSKYEAPEVDLKHLELWSDFFDNDEIKEMVADPRWNDVLTKPFGPEDLRKIRWDSPEAGGNISEHTFELLWFDITSALNLIHLKCAQRDQGVDDPIRIVIGSGECAKKMTSVPYKKHLSTRENRQGGHEKKKANTKKPDYAAYLHVPGSKQQELKHKRMAVDNRIPGDAKLCRKIRRSMFPPDGEEYQPRNRKILREVGKVVTQIHDYMDRHEARYGYIVNDEELIFFRRRGTGWGHMDISPAIRHDTNGSIDYEISNTKLVLFYFLIEFESIF